MPITFARAYQANGKAYATLEEAQRAEIESLFAPAPPDDPWTPTRMATAIVANSESIVNILTITDSSRPRARGVPKKRKPKTDAAPVVVLESVPAGVVTS